MVNHQQEEDDDHDHDHDADYVFQNAQVEILMDAAIYNEAELLNSKFFFKCVLKVFDGQKRRTWESFSGMWILLTWRCFIS